MSADDDPFGGFAGENGADVDEGALVRRERLVRDRGSRFRQGPGDVLDRPGLVLFITRRARVAGFGQVEDVLFQFLLQPRADGSGGSAAGRGGGAVGNDAARGDGEDGQGGKQREVNPEFHAPFISIRIRRDNFNVAKHMCGSWKPFLPSGHHSEWGISDEPYIHEEVSGIQKSPPYIPRE